jgi:hypothetical protein
VSLYNQLSCIYHLNLFLAQEKSSNLRHISTKVAVKKISMGSK